MPRSTAPRPRIGITTSFDAKKNDSRLLLKYSYVESVLKAGGLPVVLPPVPTALIDAQLAPLDGLVFIGGPDYCPARYGEKTGPKTEVIAAVRETYDFALFDLARRRKLPSLYVCGGLQLAAIAFGCKLVQDIPSEWPRPRGKNGRVQKAVIHAKGAEHPVEVARGSLLNKITGSTRLTTNSYHHQAINPATVPPGLVLTARAPDGVVEALEVEPGGKFDNGAFFLAVQWHPERMHTRRPHLALFQRLIAEARASS